LRTGNRADSDSARRGEGFTGVIDLVRMKALTFAGDNSGKMTEGEIPERSPIARRRPATS
jgi:hypothetical protein